MTTEHKKRSRAPALLSRSKTRHIRKTHLSLYHGPVVSIGVYVDMLGGIDGWNPAVVEGNGTGTRGSRTKRSVESGK